MSDDDQKQVTTILEQLDLSNLATTYMNELSGGQMQMASLGQALVSLPRILLLDEPTSSLDIKNELYMLERIKEYTTKHNTATVMTIHSLSQAARYADHLIVMHNGHIKASGSPDEILSPSLIRDVYGVETRLIRDNGDMILIPQKVVRMDNP